MSAQRDTVLGLTVARGAAAGFAGTVVMTGFQRLVEMPLTGRSESYAPADFAERVLPISTKSARGRRALNYATHFSIGITWGVTHAIAERAGLRGQRAVAAVFAGIYVGDGIANTALGLYKPWTWSAQDWATDIGEKLILAESVSLIYGRLGEEGSATSRSS